MVELQRIAAVRKMRKEINTKANVKSKEEPRTVNLKRGGTINVCDAIIADGDTEEDQIKLTLWGDDIQKVNIGDTVVITNGYTNEFKGEIALTKGRYGQMEVNPE